MGVKSWKEELEKEHVKAKAMKRKFGSVGLGFEDQLGAMQLDAWGEPMWKRDAGQWLNRRSEDAKVCVTDLIDHMITESNKIYAGTDMEDRFLMFHDALAPRCRLPRALSITGQFIIFDTTKTRNCQP